MVLPGPMMARTADGEPHPDHDETCEAAWIDPARLHRLPLHPSMRLRIDQALTDPDVPHID